MTRYSQIVFKLVKKSFIYTYNKSYILKKNRSNPKNLEKKKKPVLNYFEGALFFNLKKSIM